MKRPNRTLGTPHDEFWGWTAKRELRLQHCDDCAKLRWPASPDCDGCGSTKFVWVKMSGLGRVISWGTFVQDYYKGVMPLPYDTILVELEEGPLMISNPQGFSNDDITFGMAVSVDFIACEDDAGSFLLPVFNRA